MSTNSSSSVLNPQAQSFSSSTAQEDCLWVSLAHVLFGTPYPRELWRRKQLREALLPFYGGNGAVLNPKGVVDALNRLGFVCFIQTKNWNNVDAVPPSSEITNYAQIAKNNKAGGIIATAIVKSHSLRQTLFAHAFNVEHLVSGWHYVDYQRDSSGHVADAMIDGILQRLVQARPSDCYVTYEIIGFYDPDAARRRALAMLCDR